jgi:hypothetical protein
MRRNGRKKSRGEDREASWHRRARAFGLRGGCVTGVVNTRRADETSAAISAGPS